MQQTYHDGRTIDYSGLTPDGLADALRSAAENADKIAHLEVWSQMLGDDSSKDSGPYPNNRQGRRRYARDLRRKNKA